MRKFTYYVPKEIRLTAPQIAAIIQDNMEHWGMSEEEAKECCEEDYLLAASRLGYLDLPVGTRFDE